MDRAARAGAEARRLKGAALGQQPAGHAAAQPQPPTLYQGHTRFATSSISSLDGAHPHQWTPAAKGRVWWYDDASASYVSKMANVEAFITHNGDLDFFSINGQTYALGELRTLLQQGGLLGRALSHHRVGHRWRRHQAVRVGQRGRPVRRGQSAPAHQGLRLLLLLDQPGRLRLLAHVHPRQI